MSADAEAWVWKHSPYKGAAFIIHLAMADVVNDMHGNEFWASNSTLAEKARVGRQAANEAVRQMVQDGLLLVLETPRRRGQYAPVRYRFLMPDATVIWSSHGPDRVASDDTADGSPCRLGRHDRVASDDTTVSPLTTQTQRGTQEGTQTSRARAEDAPAPTLFVEAGSSASASERETPQQALDRDFAEWYAEYPRKKARQQALGAYKRARKKEPRGAVLVEGLRRSIKGWKAEGRDPQFIPYPATWLNAGSWTDEPDESPPEHAQGPARPARAQGDLVTVSADLDESEDVRDLDPRVQVLIDQRRAARARGDFTEAERLRAEYAKFALEAI